MEKSPIIEVRQLCLAYGPRVLCSDISFTLDRGECLLLAGPNGCGKSTLLKTLATRDGAKSAFIPTGIPKVKGFTVEEFIRTGCYRESDWAGRLNGEAMERMQEALALLGLEARREQDISTLSDGEFQKACIAVGLTRHAQVLLLDEPTAFLDVENRIMVLRTLQEVTRRTGMAVLFSSHDLHDALQVAGRVLAFTPGGNFLESQPQNREQVLQAAFPLFRP